MSAIPCVLSEHKYLSVLSESKYACVLSKYRYVLSECELYAMHIFLFRLVISCMVLWAGLVLSLSLIILKVW